MVRTTNNIMVYLARYISEIFLSDGDSTGE